MKKLRKLMCVVLALVMALTGLPSVMLGESAVETVKASTEGTYTVGNSTYAYTVNDDYTVTIDDWTGTDANIVIPSTIEGYPVTTIGYGAFQLKYGLESVTLPDTVSDLEPYAFMGCVDLKEFKLSDDNEYFTCKDGVLYTANGGQLAYYPAGKVGLYQLPSQVKCLEFSWLNAMMNSYTTHAEPVYSYLTTTDNGGWMKLSYFISVEFNGMLIEYYDKSYNCQSRYLLNTELTAFGGFYESDDHYYVLSGDQNVEEDGDRIVYSVVKYDKSWNRLDSLELRGCYTVYPFEDGSARMAMYGDYLYIYTCHTMYANAAGVTTQANASIVVDTKDMTYSDMNMGTASVEYGYVTNSLNQYIEIDGKDVILVDHGNAYPRSVVLMRYNDAAASGQLRGQCDYVDVLKIAGEVGDNNTGVSVGGLEIAADAYLVAGNTVIQDENFDQYDTSDVFIAAVDKDTLEVKVNKITSYVEGEDSSLTPQLVKINDNKFMLMWQSYEYMNYVLVDGKGNVISDIYTMDAYTSDCQPIVVGNKVVWYVWYVSETFFYEIDLNNLAKNKEVHLSTEHTYEVETITGGVVLLKCTLCEATTTEYAAEEVRLSWDLEGDNVYIYTAPTEVYVGQEIGYGISVDPWNADDPGMLIFSDPAAVECTEPNSIGYGTMTFKRAGTYTVTVRAKWDATISRSYTINVLESEDIIYGDVNGDSVISVADGVTLKQHLAGSEPDMDDIAADVNKDGYITVQDAVQVMQHLAGIDVGLKR